MKLTLLIIYIALYTLSLALSNHFETHYPVAATGFHIVFSISLAWCIGLILGRFDPHRGKTDRFKADGLGQQIALIACISFTMELLSWWIGLDYFYFDLPEDPRSWLALATARVAVVSLIFTLGYALSAFIKPPGWR